MARALTAEEIQTLVASDPKNRKIAIENFLSSMPIHLTLREQLGNLALDADLYRWNPATVNTIRKGINLAYGLGS